MINMSTRMHMTTNLITKNQLYNTTVGIGGPPETIDNAIWLEWVSIARQRHRTDLMDPYVDPITEKHMSLLFYHHNSSTPSIAAASDSIESSLLLAKPPIMRYDKRRRLPQQRRGVNRENESMRASPNKMLTATATAAMSLADQVMMQRSCTKKRSQCSDSKSNWQECCFASYPNAADVERALEGCGLSQVLAPWESQKPKANDEHHESHSPAESLLEPKSHTMGSKDRDTLRADTKDETNTETCWLNAAEVGTVFEGSCRITSDFWKKPQKQRLDGVHPSGKAVSYHHKDAFSDGPASREAHPAASSGFSVSFLESQEPPLQRVTTSAILQEQNKLWNEIQLQRQEHVQSQHGGSSNGRQDNSHNDASRSQAQAQPPSPQLLPNDAIMRSSMNQPRQVPVEHATRTRAGAEHRSISRLSYRYDKKSTEDSSSSYTPPMFVSDRHHNQRLGTPVGKKPVATVPCLGCEAPLKISAVPTLATTVVYCPACGTMASSDLMRTLISPNRVSNSSK